MSIEDEVSATLTRLALAGDGIVLGLGMGALAICTWTGYRSHSKALKQMKAAPQVPLGELGSWLESDPERQQPLVFVRGKISNDKDPLHAQNADERGVVVERTQTYLYSEWRGLLGWGSGWRTLLNWSSLKEQISSSTRKVPFVLVDDKDCTSVRVNLDDSRHPLPLVTVYHQLQVVPRSSATMLQALFGRRHPVGVIDEERMLLLGKEVTAVGTLSTSPEGSVVVKSCSHLPRFLTELDRERLIEDISVGTNVLFYGGVIFTGVAVAVLSYSLFKNWFKWKAWKLARSRQAEETREASDEVEEDGDVPEGELCVVCLLRRRRAAFVSCGHRVCCMACARRVGNSLVSKCPVCRQSVTGVIRIYDA